MKSVILAGQETQITMYGAKPEDDFWTEKQSFNSFRACVYLSNYKP